MILIYVPNSHVGVIQPLCSFTSICCCHFYILVILIGVSYFTVVLIYISLMTKDDEFTSHFKFHFFLEFSILKELIFLIIFFY